MSNVCDGFYGDGAAIMPDGPIRVAMRCSRDGGCRREGCPASMIPLPLLPAAVHALWREGPPSTNGWWIIRTEMNGWSWITLVLRAAAPARGPHAEIDPRPIFWIGSQGDRLSQQRLLPGAVTHHAPPGLFTVLLQALSVEYTAPIPEAHPNREPHPAWERAIVVPGCTTWRLPLGEWAFIEALMPEAQPLRLRWCVDRTVRPPRWRDFTGNLDEAKIAAEDALAPSPAVLAWRIK